MPKWSRDRSRRPGDLYLSPPMVEIIDLRGPAGKYQLLKFPRHGPMIEHMFDHCQAVANPVCGFQVVSRSANRSEPRPCCWQR
jgi:hypothetical protein